MDRLPAPNGWLDPPFTLAAFVIWGGLVACMFWLRKKMPVLAFGLMFFLAGHLLESTFLNLELYFAHRNYVPAFGLYFALVYSLTQIPKQYIKLAWVGFTGYLVLFAFVLYQVTSGWSNLYTASHFWFEKNPYSERATQLLANQLIANGDFIGARRIFDKAAERSPSVAMLQIQRTQFCREQEAEFPDLLKETEEKLRVAAYHQFAAIELFKISHQYNPETSANSTCPPRDYDAFARLVQALLDNPLYAENDFTHGYLIATLGLIAVHRDDDLERGADLFEQAFAIYPAQDFATYGAFMMGNLGQFERAYAFLDSARELAPKQPFKRIERLRHYDEVQTVIEAAQAMSEQSETPVDTLQMP
ncbi:hypothetical protein [Thiorhodospira sibirica]|uniref:hypothetical protein n=1 Tax=Thiorhodospira sibirica TaxID=154347 RepID=UPI00022C4C28|nr:hypothetical protein [Thiorhodospira sibirica]